MTESERRGQTIGVDFAISLAVFITAIAIGIYYTNVIALPSSPFSSQIQNSVLGTVENVETAMKWSFTAVPVAATAGSEASWYPLYVSYDYPDAVDNNSIVGNAGGTRIPVQADLEDNVTVMLANLSDGSIRRQLVYRKGSNFSELADLTSLSTSESGATVEVDTANMSVTLDSAGIDDLTYDSTQLVTNTDFDTDGSEPSGDGGPVWSRVEFGSDPLVVDVTARSDHVRAGDELSGETTYDLNLSSDVADVVAVNESGDTVSESIGSGPAYTGEADGLRFRTAAGEDLLVTSDDMEVFVYSEGSGQVVEVNVTVPGGDRELLVRPGAGIDALDATRRFLRVSAVQLPTERLDGYGKGVMQEFESKSESEQRRELGLTDLRYNITVEGIVSVGQDLETSQEARVLSYPVGLVSREGNWTSEAIQVAVWQ